MVAELNASDRAASATVQARSLSVSTGTTTSTTTTSEMDESTRRKSAEHDVEKGGVEEKVDLPHTGPVEVAYDETSPQLEKAASRASTAGPIWQPPVASTKFGRIRDIVWPPTPPVGANVGPMPEGGYRAWLVVFGSFWAMAFSFGCANAFAAFQQYYTTDLLSDYSQSAIAFIGAFQYGAIYICGLAGKGFDLGFFKPVMAFAMCLFVLSWILASFSSSYWSIFLTQAVMQGIAQGLIFNYGISCPSHWFLRRRAFALGVMAGGSSVGGTVLPIMVSNLIPRVGYAWTMRIIALLSGCIFLVSFVCMRPRLAPALEVRNGGWRRIRWIDLSFFKEAPFTIFVFSSLLVFEGFYNPFNYQTVFAAYHNIPHGQYFISIMNASSMLGRVIPGYFADKGESARRKLVEMYH